LSGMAKKKSQSEMDLLYEWRETFMLMDWLLLHFGLVLVFVLQSPKRYNRVTVLHASCVTELMYDSLATIVIVVNRLRNTLH
jgi:hypothetical protein